MQFTDQSVSSSDHTRHQSDKIIDQLYLTKGTSDVCCDFMSYLEIGK